MPRQQFLAEFVPRLRFLLDSIAHEPEMFADHYRSFCSLTGRQIVVYVAGIRHEGTCGGIAPDGRLILDTPAGEMQIVSGSLTPPDEIWRGDGCPGDGRQEQGGDPEAHPPAWPPHTPRGHRSKAAWPAGQSPSHEKPPARPAALQPATSWESSGWR